MSNQLETHEAKFTRYVLGYEDIIGIIKRQQGDRYGELIRTNLEGPDGTTQLNQIVVGRPNAMDALVHLRDAGIENFDPASEAWRRIQEEGFVKWLFSMPDNHYSLSLLAAIRATVPESPGVTPIEMGYYQDPKFPPLNPTDWLRQQLGEPMQARVLDDLSNRGLVIREDRGFVAARALADAYNGEFQLRPEGQNSPVDPTSLGARDRELHERGRMYALLQRFAGYMSEETDPPVYDSGNWTAIRDFWREQSLEAEKAITSIPEWLQPRG